MEIEEKISSWIGFLVILGILAPASWYGYSVWEDINEVAGSHYEQVYDQMKTKETKANISEAEKSRIDKWILENNLNQYGDPKDTVYTGGTPLFDEATGEKIDKYEYIIRNYPEKPWNK